MGSVLDMLLRWAVLRFLEERQQAVVRVQAFTAELLASLGTRGYQATDNEANVFLPCLCEKVGHNQERVRGGYVKILTLFRAIYSPHRFIVFLLEVCFRAPALYLPFAGINGKPFVPGSSGPNGGVMQARSSVFFRLFRPCKSMTG